MSGFSEFVKSFCVVALSSGLVYALSPSGKLKKYVKFIVSLCVVTALIYPIITFAKTVPDKIENIKTDTDISVGNIYNEIYSEITSKTRENIENEVKNSVCSRFGYDENDVFVIVTLDTENISAVNITDVTVFVSDISKKEKINSYLSELFLYRVNINIMKKGE